MNTHTDTHIHTRIIHIRTHIHTYAHLHRLFYINNLLCGLHYCVDQQAGSSEVHFDPNAVYAQVDKNKKRSTRRSTGKDDFAPAQHAPYPVDETAGGDSWV